jgi:pyrroloquinoline quinone biosynthesis protein A
VEIPKRSTHPDEKHEPALVKPWVQRKALPYDDVLRLTIRPVVQPIPKRRFVMQWIDPAYSDIRLGFEVTAYVYVR